MLLLNQLQSGEIESLFRSSGKIYVVIGVLTIIFVGIIIYLIMLDRKMSKLEKMLNESDKK